MGLNLEEMEARKSTELPDSDEEVVHHVAVVEDEETGIITRMPLHFHLGHGGTLTIRHYPSRVEDQDFRKGAVGTE